jgi:hypothetical protein
MQQSKRTRFSQPSPHFDSLEPRRLLSAPPAPADLEAYGGTPGFGAQSSVDLVWSEVPRTDYIVQRQKAGDSGFTNLNVDTISDTTFRDNTASTSTTYFYRVLAEDVNGVSAPSNTVTVVAGSELGTDNTDLTLGAGGAEQITLGSGTSAQLSLTAGAATVHLTGMRLATASTPDGTTVTGLDLTLYSIDATGTTPSSSLKITGDTALPIQSISIHGSIHSIVAPGWEVRDLNLTGTIAKIMLQGAGSFDSGSWTFGQAGASTSIDLSNMGGNIATPGVLSVVKAGAWNGSINAAKVSRIKLTDNGLESTLNLNAERLGSLTVMPDPTGLEVGSLADSTINLTGGGMSLGSLRVPLLQTTTIRAAGSIGSIKVRAMWSCQISAGVSIASPSQRLPLTKADFASRATIGSVKVFNDFGFSNGFLQIPSFIDSTVTAAVIHDANLGSAQFLSTREFGIAAERIGTLAFADSVSGKLFRDENLSNPVTLAAQLAAFGVPLQEMAVRIVI